MKTLTRVTGLLAGLLFSVTAAAAPTPPDELVRKVADEVQQGIAKNQKEFKADSKKLYAYVDKTLVPVFDTRYIAQLILARNWKAASEDQRNRFEVAFKNMLIHTYANALIEYHDSIKAEWLPLRAAPDATDVTVQSKVVRSGGKPPLPIGFAMRLKGDQWKVYDIVVENLSLVTSFRSQVNSEIKKSGLDALIQKLESGQGLGPAK